MPIDVKAISKSLRGFVRSHNAEFQKLTRRQSQLLEVGAFLVAAKHYELAGYEVDLKNPRGKRMKVKLTTNGHPWNFSRFEIALDSRRFEIHTNLPVEDAAQTPGARYVVDVAVTASGCVPTAPPDPDEERFVALPNEHLVTFIEAKALVVYPMLIAQFIGIVHELQPDFLNDKIPGEFDELLHFEPSLVSLGYLHSTCFNIVKGLEARKIRIGIVAKFDNALSRLGYGMSASPLAREPLSDPSDIEHVTDEGSQISVEVS
jgi:hypothetical protein